jgi:hypothetical protein
MKLFTEKGEVNLGDKFLSPRIVKDTLGKSFNVSVVDERSNYIKLRIVRLARLYGFPVIWPQASIAIWIKNENDKLIYEFFWPEYLILIIPFILFLFIEERMKEFMLFILFALIFFGFLIFLDTRWVVRRVRKAIESI